MSEPVPEFLRESFERGYHPMDEPPGLEERFYKQWLAEGGKIRRPSQSIYKYPLVITDRQDIPLPGAAQILSVQVQLDRLHLWAIVEPDQPPAPVTIEIVGTGNPIDPNFKRRHLATVQVGKLVWHVFQITEVLAR